MLLKRREGSYWRDNLRVKSAKKMLEIEFVSVTGKRTQVIVNDGCIYSEAILALGNKINISPSKIFGVIGNEILDLSNCKIVIPQDIKNIFYILDYEASKCSKYEKYYNLISEASVNNHEVNSDNYIDYNDELEKIEEFEKNDPPNINALVENMVNLGISPNEALEALRNNDYNLDEAANEALNGEPDIQNNVFSNRIFEYIRRNHPQIAHYVQELGFDENDILASEPSPIYDDFLRESENNTSLSQLEALCINYENNDPIPVLEELDDEIVVFANVERGHVDNNDQIRGLMNSLTSAEVTALQALCSENIPFSEVVQMYIISDKNIETTRMLLGM